MSSGAVNGYSCDCFLDWCIAFEDCVLGYISWLWLQGLFRFCLLILVDKKAIDTCVHNHIVLAYAWNHVGRVEKNPYPTHRQTLKSKLKAKLSFLLIQICAEF